MGRKKQKKLLTVEGGLPRLHLIRSMVDAPFCKVC